jgi:TrmH family RNA methyltransferase
MEDLIRSTQNKWVKDFVLLREKSKARKSQNRFIVEGLREFNLARESGFEIDKIFICPEIIDKDELVELESNLRESSILYCSSEVYQKIAYRGGTEGLVAKMIPVSRDFKTLKIPTAPLILVAEAPEKPGNIGALLRTADAANIDLICIADLKTDLYNPNVIRSSVGCVFTTNVIVGSSSEIFEFLRKKELTIFAAALKPYAKSYLNANFTKSSALVVGTEADGLSDFWLKNVDETIIIPMEGKIDSLNVSISASVILFEAKRQRK